MDFKSFIGSMAQELRGGSSVSKATRRVVGRMSNDLGWVPPTGDGFQAFINMIQHDLDKGQTAPRALRRAVLYFDRVFAEQASNRLDLDLDEEVPF